MEEISEYQIKGLRDGVYLYAPVLMYLFLKRRENGYKPKLNRIDNALDTITINWESGIYGAEVSKWPQSEQDAFDRLFTPEKKWFDLQREFIYFLIFSLSQLAFKFIQDNSQKEKVLDGMFSLFGNADMPWFRTPPDLDAYDKYNESKNYLLLFSKEIKRITNEDPALVFYFTDEVFNVLLYIIGPAVTKLFQTK